MNAFCKRFCITTVAAVALCAASIGVIHGADVFAVDPTYTYKINTGDASNRYAVYSLGTMTQIGMNLDDPSNPKPAYEFTANSDFEDFFDSGANGYVIREDGIYRVVEVDGGSTIERKVDSNSDDASLLGNLIAKYIQTANADTTTISPTTTITGSTPVTLPLGYYVTVQTVVGSSDANNGYIASRPILAILDENTEVTPKNMHIEVAKSISRDNGAHFSGATSVTVGESVRYAIVASIPNYGYESTRAINSNNFTFNLGDSIPNSINVAEDSIKVYVLNANEELSNINFSANNDPHLVSEDSWWSLSPTKTFHDPDDMHHLATFTVVTTSDILANTMGSKIVISYEGTVNSDVVSDNTTGNVNTATLTYSTNPMSSNATNSITSTATAYSYGFKLCKQDPKHVDGDDQPIYDLYGAQFLIQKVTSVNDQSGTTINNYTISASDPDAVTGQSCLKIRGLGEGIYKITETKASQGYVTPSTPIFITVSNNDILNGRSTIAAASNTGLDTLFHIVDNTNLADGTFAATVTVYNRKATDLPETGAIGTIVCVILGTVITGIGGVVLVRSNRKEQQ